MFHDLPTAARLIEVAQASALVIVLFAGAMLLIYGVPFAMEKARERPPMTTPEEKERRYRRQVLCMTVLSALFAFLSWVQPSQGALGILVVPSGWYSLIPKRSAPPLIPERATLALSLALLVALIGWTAWQGYWALAMVVGAMVALGVVVELRPGAEGRARARAQMPKLRFD